MNWEYGKAMLEDEQVESLDGWSDKKEFVYKTMDREFDYLWYEDEEGFHFIDRIWSDYGTDESSYAKELIATDELIAERNRDDELEMHFATIDDVIEWLKGKGVDCSEVL